MNSPNLINPLRVRQIPRHFSWLDHRLIHEEHLKKISAEGCCLYLFLTCVGDEFGLSYYSDSAIMRRLSLTEITPARQELITHNLIAYNKPFYQVLALPEKSSAIEDKGVEPDALRSWLEGSK